MAAGWTEAFFKLGEKATGGDITRKAKFDYQLYWIVFLAFVFIALNYYYNFFFNHSSISTLAWALVITVFTWFNYWGLVAFRTNYINMLDAQKIIKSQKDKTKDSTKKDIDEMMEGFKD